MQIEPEIMILGFVLGLGTGITTDLINKLVSAFSHWVSSW